VVENQLITRTAGKAQSEGAWPCRSVDEGRGWGVEYNPSFYEAQGYDDVDGCQ